jgi:hypothetical protein
MSLMALQLGAASHIEAAANQRTNRHQERKNAPERYPLFERSAFNQIVCVHFDAPFRFVR